MDISKDKKKGFFIAQCLKNEQILNELSKSFFWE